MSTAEKLKVTPREYAALEERSEVRHEFHRGEVFAMAGASLAHNAIVANITRRLNEQLEDGPCIAVGSDMRVKVEATGLHTYPDVVVLCGEPEFDHEVPNTLLNPIVLVEVLSESTERYDRRTKSGHYRRIESLREYLLVAQDECLVEQYVRADRGHWILTDANDPEEAVTLESIGCTLRLADIYAKIEMPPPKDDIPPAADEVREPRAADEPRGF
ncbi:MAG: Uma2 family endonuclease [Planctomycetaceae bacterium]